MAAIEHGSLTAPVSAIDIVAPKDLCFSATSETARRSIFVYFPYSSTGLRIKSLTM